MALDQSFAGRTYPPTAPYAVGREKIREFADAIGDPNPVYRDRAAAEALGHPDVIAPPTFPIVLSMRAAHQVVLDPELGLDYSRVVHGEQRFVYHRPVRAGDELVVVVTVESIRSAAGNDIMTTRGDVSTTAGEPVVTAYSTLVSRGTAAPAETTGSAAG
jgi:acyl dehydratase